MKAQRKLVSFIGLGSQSAVPLLYSYIRLHPAVFVPSDLTRFFSSTKAFAKGIGWYEAHFNGHKAGQICGELASSYLKSPTAVSLIARTYPSAKLLAVVENPLVSVRVAYVDARRAKAIPPDISLAMFLKQNPEVLVDAKYGKQISQYFSYYASTDLVAIAASDVRDHTLDVLAKAYKHIGVDESYVPLILQHLIPVEEEVNAKKPGLIKRSFRLIKKVIAKGYRTLINKINPPDIPQETSSDVARSIPLSPELETYLLNYFRHDVLVLSNTLQRNFSLEWGFETEE